MSTSSSTTTYSSSNKKPVAIVPKTIQFSVSHKRHRLELPPQIETQENVARLPSDRADEALSNERKKVIKSEYDKERYTNNIEKIKEQKREYYQKNTEKMKKQNNEWYQNNKEKINAQRKIRRDADKEKKKIVETKELADNAYLKYLELQTKKSKKSDDSDNSQK